MDERLDLWDSEELYKKCKQFCDTWEFGKECNNRKGMYEFLEGIEMDLYNQKNDIINELGITDCPFHNRDD